MAKKILIVILFSGLMCFNSCEKLSGERVWAYFNETGCSNPWDRNQNISIESTVKDFLNTNHIKVFEVTTRIYSDGPFCEACFCPTGRTIQVLISSSDVTKIEKLGFYITVQE